MWELEIMSNRKFITDGEGLPQWENPISHAVVVNNMCFISGQLSVNAEGKYIPGTIEEETQRAFDNVFSAAKAAEFDRSEIVYIDIAFSDLSQVKVVNEIYMHLFPVGRRPARTIYEAAALPFGGKVKIVATAVKDLV
jgi:2-iminobutanoate/2-iminopropanoate deaminase